MKMLIGAGADNCGYALICKLIKEDHNLKEKQIKKLLYAGACVNVEPENAPTLCLKRNTGGQDELAQLMFAAGEELNKVGIKVPDYLKPPEQMNLMHLCRESIRKHLLQMSKMNLLVRVPELGLPSKLVKYIFYGLEDESIKRI